jgi:hypothetical protein
VVPPGEEDVRGGARRIQDLKPCILPYCEDRRLTSRAQKARRLTTDGEYRK